MAGGLPVPAGMDARYRESFGAVLRMVKLLYDSGVPLVAGTDGLPGFSLVHELELYEAAGIPAAAILRIATIGAARTMHMERELGTISPGKLADMIVVDGDPTQHIGALRGVRIVIKGGTLYAAAALRATLGVGSPAHP
jgi:imidazolonepropionase-like amidohydrolase